MSLPWAVMIKIFPSVQIVQDMWRIRIFLPSSCPIKFHVDFRFKVRDDGFKQSFDQVSLDSDVAVFEKVHVQTLTPIE